jgi:putative SbcD/Mre11-related phosphoesterase
MIVLGEWLLTPERVAIHRPTGTAVAADLHLGYDDSRRRRGDAVPIRPVPEQLAPLGRALECARVARVLFAGDVFEDGKCAAASRELREWLDKEKVELVGIVPGNHDRAMDWGALPIFAEGYALGAWRVVHGDGPTPEGRVVQGHEHPCLRFSPQAGGPCYLVRDHHLVLPAFGRDTAGVNVLGRQRWRDYRACAIAGEEVLDFGAVGGLAGPGRRSATRGRARPGG